MAYYSRIVEQEIERKLNASGALLIKGPKSCGKTETAKQFAKSILLVDRDEQVPVVMGINPKILLSGATHDCLMSGRMSQNCGIMYAMK
jgi:hypothetical protein